MLSIYIFILNIFSQNIKYELINLFYKYMISNTFLNNRYLLLKCIYKFILLFMNGKIKKLI